MRLVIEIPAPDESIVKTVKEFVEQQRDLFLSVQGIVGFAKESGLAWTEDAQVNEVEFTQVLYQFRKSLWDEFLDVLNGR
jgi:hypothetical protein